MWERACRPLPSKLDQTQATLTLAILSHWSVYLPLVGMALLAAATQLPVGALLGTACGIALIGAVIAAVHHAEVIAHRVGEPFGTLVLALAITAIESSLIVSVMLAGGEDKAALARDTMYATVMIIANGVVGACILLGALRHREQAFRIEGAGPALAALATLATLVLVLPGFTVSAEGPRYTASQLAFVALSSLTVWARSCSSRPSVTGITSCRREAPATKRCTPHRRRADRHGGASRFCWWRWSRWSGWRKCSRR